MKHPTKEILAESVEDIQHLITQTSWLLMDDDQRDEFMLKVVLPRYMVETSDGVRLTPKWWSEQTGASARAIESRVYRLRGKASSDIDPHAPSPTESQKGQVRGAKAALKKYPELADKLVEDDEVAAAVVQAAQRKLDKKRKEHLRDHGPRKEHKTGLEAAGVAIKCETIEGEFDELEVMVNNTLPTEVLQLLDDYLKSWELRLDIISTRATTNTDWDDALKELS